MHADNARVGRRPAVRRDGWKAGNVMTRGGQKNMEKNQAVFKRGEGRARTAQEDRVLAQEASTVHLYELWRLHTACMRHSTR